MATPGTDDVGGPKASEISELRRLAKWNDFSEEIKEEDEFLIVEELKLLQRFNFLAMDRPDLLYSVKELMRKMAFHHVHRQSNIHEWPADVCGLHWAATLRCLATHTLLDVFPRESPQLEW